MGGDTAQQHRTSEFCNTFMRYEFNYIGTHSQLLVVYLTYSHYIQAVERPESELLLPQTFPQQRFQILEHMDLH
jgi:hypothetical protein